MKRIARWLGRTRTEETDDILRTHMSDQKFDRRKFVKYTALGTIIGGAAAMGSGAAAPFTDPPTTATLSPYFLNLIPRASRPSGIPQSGIWMGTDGYPKLYDTLGDVKLVRRTPNLYPMLNVHPLSNLNPVMTGLAAGAQSKYCKDPAIYPQGYPNPIWMYFTFGTDALGHDVAYAKTSVDDTFDFTYQGIAIPRGADGSVDEIGAFAPSNPIKVGSTYYMWYVAVKDVLGNNNPDIAAQVPWSVAYATSTNLTSWTKQGLVLDASSIGHVLDPFVVAAVDSPDGLYRLYASHQAGGDSYRKVYMWTSAVPGGPWTKYGVVFDPVADGFSTWSGGVENPAVFQTDDTWFLLVDRASVQHMYLCASYDGTHFDIVQYPRLLGYGRINSIDTQGAAAASPFFIDSKDKYRLFLAYQAFGWSGQTGLWTICLAEAHRQAGFPSSERMARKKMLRSGDTPTTTSTTSQSYADIANTTYTFFVAQLCTLVVDVSLNVNFDVNGGYGYIGPNLQNEGAGQEAEARYVFTPTANKAHAYAWRTYFDNVKSGITSLHMKGIVLSGTGTDTMTLSELTWHMTENIVQ